MVVSTNVYKNRKFIINLENLLPCITVTIPLCNFMLYFEQRLGRGCFTRYNNFNKR